MVYFAVAPVRSDEVNRNVRHSAKGAVRVDNRVGAVCGGDGRELAECHSDPSLSVVEISINDPAGEKVYTAISKGEQIHNTADCLKPAVVR
jgi:hypothetical protein